MLDTVGAIIRYENGELDDVETTELFQDLVDSGLAWKLQGHYGRTARDLIVAGLVVDRIAERRAQRAGLPETTFRHHGPAHPKGFRPIGGGR